MPIGVIFWVLMIIWAVFSWVPGPWAQHGWASNVLLFVLFFLLGWHAFGFVVHQ